MHSILLTFCLLAITLLSMSDGVATSNKGRPNVLVIMTDDQGSIDLGSYGAKDLKTPNFDQLAKDGTRFTQFYAAAPVCSPSRAGLLTGRRPEKAGVPGNVSSRPDSKLGLPHRETTMAELFKAQGYRTALIGKWHLGYSEGKNPNTHGFDYYVGPHGGAIDNYSHFNYWRGPNRHDLYRNGEEIFASGEFFPDLLVKEAQQFLQTESEQPFFMYFALNMPHYPYQGDTKWLEYYNKQGVKYPRNLYNAFVSTLDERIGQLMAALKEIGLDENTIVVYQSDHGHSTEERAHFGGGNAGPYRGAKKSLFEGGLRVPFIVRWPNFVEAGGVRDQLVSSLDILPSLAAWTPIDISGLDLDGKDISQVFESASNATPHDNMFWHFQKSWAVREGDWKLHYQPLDTTLTNKPAPLAKEDIYFLVNLKQDVGERHNLASKYPDKVNALTALAKLKMAEK
jgi:arylsulfatase A